MAKEATHSELPWEEVPGDHLIMDANGITVLDLMDGGEDVDDSVEESQGEVSSSRAELNKKLIVKAVNSYEKNIAAMRTAIHQLDRACDDEMINHNRYIGIAIQRLNAAMNAAGEK